ncbi:MAG TPA: thioredoxin domain-containing protein [Polyangia bacterium]
MGCKQATLAASPARIAEEDPALPGRGVGSPVLAVRLRAALLAKGAAYHPRTRHLNADGSPKYTNRLILESSPYLLQHAHNPVNWYPWGDEAFARAKREGKPIFLSVGYSTCHWCHVMEAESFEDEEIARYLNEHYVAIKVDREERPDIDAVYMSAVQALTGSGGWPMSVWLTPERAPFFGGTYFPPRDGVRGARQGFLTLLVELADTYRRDPGRVTTEAAKLTDAVRRELGGADPASIGSIGSIGSMGSMASAGGQAVPDAAIIRVLVEQLERAFDHTNGGLEGAPKFPSSLPIRLLLRYHRRTGDADALRMAVLTLEKMAAGGIYDQIGGGFHRYSTDARWLVPHFEKMLYDNALLAVAFLEANQVTGRADFARVARETLDYVLAEMTAPSGAFYSATDADSDGAEGKFFVWSEAEIRAVLGADPVADRFIRYYGVTSAGNFDGRNILYVPRANEQERAALSDARAKLYAARARRIPPARDDKILAGWNGLMISALALGGGVLGEPRYTGAAARAADFVLRTMRTGGLLARSFKDGRAGPPGFLEDYAFLAAGLFDLYEASFDPRWLREALALCAQTETLFADPATGGWFATGSKHEKLLAREKPTYDGAIPSGTSVAILDALRAATFTGDDHWRAIADRALGALREPLARHPLGLTEALLALDFRTDMVREVAIIWPKQAGPAAAAPLLATVRRIFLPNKVLAGSAEGEDLGALAALAPFVAEKRALGGRSTAYVCERGRCELPTADPSVLARQLGRVRGY